jgi:hypothetical protein
MSSRIIRTGAAVLAVAGSSFAVATPAFAKHGDIVRQGSCSARSDWKLKLGPRDGGIETEFQVDSNRNGQKWNVRLADNGARVFAGTATTRAPSGSFTVERRIANRKGTDHVVATAMNAVTGETCRATAAV